MPGYGEAGYIGGRPWPSSITMFTSAKTPTAPSPAISPTGGGVDPVASEALKKAIAYYSPEGGYGKGVEAALGRARTKAVASGTQALVSAGLMGTTMPAGLGKKFEEEIGMPTRARVEETRAERLAGLEVLKAQITQGATEAARARALQKYLAQLQASTQFGIAGMRETPSIVSRPTVSRPTGQAGDFYVQPSGGYGSVVGGDIRETGGRGGMEFYGFGNQEREAPRTTALENVYKKARTWLDEPMGL